MPNRGTSRAGLLFDDRLYASTLPRKLLRAAMLGPRYYVSDLPRYLRHRRERGLAMGDAGALVNPLREFRRSASMRLPSPPHCAEALARLDGCGVRLSLPPLRLRALLSAWWAAREVRGDVLECGSYRGASALCLAVLAEMNGIEGRVMMLDTFAGMPSPTRLDRARRAGEMAPPPDQVAVIRRQARELGVHDRVEVHQGLFADTFDELSQRPLSLAFAHIDANIHSGTLQACEFVLPRMAPQGVLVFDDYNGVTDLGARLAIDEALARTGARPVPLAGCSAFLRCR